MTKIQRYIAAAVVVCAAFVSSYVYAATRTAGPAAGSARPVAASSAAASCACCGGGAASGPATKAEAVVENGVQRIKVDTASGSWNPSEIVLKAGAPAEITFAQGQGCLAQVLFPQLGIEADLTNGGATVRIPALAAGEYTFSCGMRMVFGKLTVR